MPIFNPSPASILPEREPCHCCASSRLSRTKIATVVQASVKATTQQLMALQLLQTELPKDWTEWKWSLLSFNISVTVPRLTVLITQNFVHVYYGRKVHVDKMSQFPAAVCSLTRLSCLSVNMVIRFTKQEADSLKGPQRNHFHKSSVLISS